MIAVLPRIAWFLPAFSLVWLTMSPARAGNVHLLGEGADLIGGVASMVSRYEDTLVDIGRAHNIGFEELKLANPGVDPWLPGEGREILLPTEFVLPAAERSGLVVNIAEFRVYFFYQNEGRNYVATLPASIGRMDWSTPLGRTRIVSRVTRPSWYPPASVREEYAAEGRELARVVPPGPDNPLGEYALRLGLPGYLIHGTNRPAGVGMRVTHGCIRLFPEDIEWLFPRTRVDMPVQIVNQPVKFGWRGDALYMEVHPALAAADGGAELTMTDVTRAYVQATVNRAANVDWNRVAQVFREQRGIPEAVGRAVAENAGGENKKAATAAAASPEARG